MSRLIDADELKYGLFHLEGETSLTDRQLGYQAGWNDALMYGVLDAPTVDAVEVVRCEDCKFFEDEDEDGDCWCYCHNDITRRDGYCSWGERDDERSKSD